MAEYIDRNLIEWYGCDYEKDPDCENRECSSCSHAKGSHAQVMQIPTANVIERSKIDNAIEKIVFLRQHRAKYITEDYKICIDSGEVLKILQECIGE